MWKCYLGLAVVLTCNPSAVFAQNAAAVFAQNTSAVFVQTGPSVSHYYIFDVGPIVGDLTLSRLNQGGQMIWNSGGHAYVYQNCTSRDLGNLGADNRLRTTSTATGWWSASQNKPAAAGVPFPIRTAPCTIWEVVQIR